MTVEVAQYNQEKNKKAFHKCLIDEKSGEQKSSPLNIEVIDIAYF